MRGQFVPLRAADGHTLQAYTVQPGVPATGGVVIVQEIFGVNAHIRSVADFYADQGYVAIAPSIFDRIEPGVDLGYGEEDRQRAMALLERFNPMQAVEDIGAAVAWLRQMKLRVGVVGFCLGGTLAYLSAARLPIDAAVGYYGGQIDRFLNERPNAPIILHFGQHDAHIPASKIEAIAQAQRQIPIYTYPAGHGFNRDGTPDYDASSAALARERTLAFRREHLGQPAG
jgi:carboxymethylenebutenolidase